MPSTALLTIDSEDRYKDFVQSRSSATTPYNFKISKSESLMPGFMTRIGISEICFPWAIPNINIKTSTMGIQWEVSGNPVVTEALAIPYGFYTPNALASYLQTYIQQNTDLSGFTMSYGVPGSFPQNEPIFEYSAGGIGNTVAFFPLPYNSTLVPPLPAYPYPPQTKQLFDVLGFSSRNTVLSLSSFSDYTYCQAIRYVDIVCNQLTNSQAQKDQTSQTIARDMLCRIYLGNGAGDGQSTIQPSDAKFCPPGCAPTTIYRNFTMPKQIQWIPNQNIPGFLQFTVYDDAGDLLDNSIVTPINKNPLASQFMDWSMTMLVSEN
jgi:hypothetical protein